MQTNERVIGNLADQLVDTLCLAVQASPESIVDISS